MQIEIKDIDYCLVSVDASASKEEIEAKKDEVITQQFAKRAVPGVRPGKLPIRSPSKCTTPSKYRRH